MTSYRCFFLSQLDTHRGIAYLNHEAPNRHQQQQAGTDAHIPSPIPQAAVFPPQRIATRSHRPILGREGPRPVDNAVQAAAMVRILDRPERESILAGPQALPLLVERAGQRRGGGHVRDGQGGDDGFVDGEEGEDEDREPGCSVAVPGPFQALGLTSEGMAASETEAGEEREDDGADGGGFGDGQGERLDAVQGDTVENRC